MRASFAPHHGRMIICYAWLVKELFHLDETRKMYPLKWLMFCNILSRVNPLKATHPPLEAWIGRHRHVMVRASDQVSLHCSRW